MQKISAMLQQKYYLHHQTSNLPFISPERKGSRIATNYHNQKYLSTWQLFLKNSFFYCWSKCSVKNFQWLQSKIIRYKDKWTKAQHFFSNTHILLCKRQLGEVLLFSFCNVVLPISYNRFWIKALRPLKPMIWLIFIIAIRFTAQSSE